MDDWEAQQRHYQALGRLADKAGEDLIGRRIVRGLGFTRAEKTIYELERRILGGTNGEAPLCERAIRVFKRLLWRDPRWSHLFSDSGNGWCWDTEVRLVRNIDEITDRYESQAYEGLPVIFTHYAASKTSRAYSCWPAADLQLLKPPFMVVQCELSDPQWRVVEQETVAFVAQFGPYQELTDESDR